MDLIGIDAGGTKTVCQLADDRLSVLAEARGEGSSLPSLGAAATEAVLAGLIADVVASSKRQPDAICVGMAGVDRPNEAEAVAAMLARIQPGAKTLVVNDGLIALEAGVPGGGAGVVLLAGTGSIAYGRDGAGRAARAGGWGSILGDEGSGYWLGRQALRAVVRAADQRGAPTALTALILAHYGVEHERGLVHHIYYGDSRPSAIAALSRLVEAAADAGDEVALDLIEAGGGDLAEIAVSVARRLHLTSCPVVLAGGVFRAVPRLAAAVGASIARTLPHATVRSLDVEPASGAVRLALAFAQGSFRLPVYAS